MADDNLKLVAAVAAAGSIGGFGGHTIGSGVDSATIESCAPFIHHAKQHEQLVCADEKLKLSQLCKGTEIWSLEPKTSTQRAIQN